MNTSTIYTPLERLLLFQSLDAYGADDRVFEEISELLTGNPLVKDNATYNTQRLTADALRQLYIGLLQEELLAEDQDGQEDGQLSRKRKQPSPTPPPSSVKDARKHRDKLPSIVNRLYARYQTEIIRAIREDEERFAAVKREIEEIERGEWDDRIRQEESVAGQNGGRSCTPEQLIQNGVHDSQSEDKKPEEARIKIEDQQDTTVQPSPKSPTSTRPEGLAISDVLNRQDVPPVSLPRPVEVARPTSQPGHSDPRTSNNGVYMQPQFSPRQGQQQPGPIRFENTFAQPPLQYGPPGNYPPYNQYPQSYQQGHRGSFSGPPNGFPPPLSPVPSQGQLGVLLPPPHVMGRPPISPSLPLEALADVAGQQYRAPSGSPMLQQAPQHPHSPYQQHPPHPQSPYTQPYATHHRSPSGNGSQQWNNQYPPLVPPQQPYPPYSPQVPNQRSQVPSQPLPLENKQYSSPYHINQRQSLPSNHTPQARQSFPNTPASRGLPSRFVTGSGTTWTPTASASTPHNFRSLPAPNAEPLSPVLHSKKLLASTKKPPKDKVQKPDPPKTAKAPKRGAQRARAGSTASSAIAGSHRSQSVTSNVDELSMDTDVANRHVKEEVETPRGIDDEVVDEPTLPFPSSRSGTKRKRAASMEPIPRTPSIPPTHVLWTRAFPKISASALEAIAGHKNASTFSGPVKEKNARGYYQLVLRPQDLKTIRSAITAGHRAATAAAPDDLPASASSASLPISEDLIPPKGIINYAQLEKELMRMFANAIMYNPHPDRGFGGKFQGLGKTKEGVVGYAIDEDSLVKDTTAMFYDVEKIVANLRSAERRSEETRDSSVAQGHGDDEEDELAGDGDSHAGTGIVAKRRRRA